MADERFVHVHVHMHHIALDHYVCSHNHTHTHCTHKRSIKEIPPMWKCVTIPVKNKTIWSIGRVVCTLSARTRVYVHTTCKSALILKRFGLNVNTRIWFRICTSLPECAYTHLHTYSWRFSLGKFIAFHLFHILIIAYTLQRQRLWRWQQKR